MDPDREVKVLFCRSQFHGDCVSLGDLAGIRTQNIQTEYPLLCEGVRVWGG